MKVGVVMAVKQYGIIKITAQENDEPIGTKSKFWIVGEGDGYIGWLFKKGRENTLENCAEKIACELAREINMPHAQYELAEVNKLRGVISKPVLDTSKGDRLIHGNELLRHYYPSDFEVLDKNTQRHLFTMERLVLCLSNDSAPILPSLTDCDVVLRGLDQFVGYLLFDVWIANQDRHDQNWAVIHSISNQKNTYRLADSFDHGSSLGRNETETRMQTLLGSKDRNQTIPVYAQKAKSGIFLSRLDDVKPLSLLALDAACQLAQKSPQAAKEWQSRIISVLPNTIESIVRRIPDDWMNEVQKQFVVALLLENQQRIRDVKL